MHLGKKIKIARITKGYTQQELADMIGKTRPLISSIEQKGKVNSYTLSDICTALGVEIGEFQVHKAHEPLPAALENSTSGMHLKNENTRLTEEIKTLKELVELQKEVIQMLKEKLNK